LRILGFGKDMAFYSLLEQQADAAVATAKEFHTLAGDMTRCDEHVARIEQIERDADNLTHELMNKIDATFVTPLDKEDLRALSSGLDDITDAIEAGTQRIAIYRLTEARDDLAPLLARLVDITVATREIVGQLRDMQNRGAMSPRLIRVHDIENESDKLYRKALTDLFNAPNPDPLNVIKWKEIYDRVEIAVDKCESVADIVESVVVKYA
jgi:predicted phosphate transport protein (TIGR00153 family)